MQERISGYQAYKLKQLGIKSFYIAMFDEYDEGTAIAKNASDYFDIPQDQWFVTASCDGYWCSQDFQLRVVGEANKMVKGLREAVKENPVPQSEGPIYTETVLKVSMWNVLQKKILTVDIIRLTHALKMISR